MTKFNIQTQVSFTTTHVIDKEEVLKQVRHIRTMLKEGDLPKCKATIMGKIVLEKFDEGGVEAAAEFMVQYSTREVLRDVLGEIAGDNTRVSPVRVQILEHNKQHLTADTILED